MRLISVFFILVLFMSNLFGQYGEEWFHYDDPVTGDPASQEISNPVVEKDEAEFFDSNSQAEIGTEMIVTSKLQFISLPLKYRPKNMKNLSFSANFPFILSKKMDYVGYTAKASGISDISVGVSYWKQAVIRDYTGKVSFKVTMPTGDYEKVVEHDLFEYPVPLGTGSWAMTATGSLNGTIDEGKFNVNASYKISTYNEQASEFPGFSKTITNYKRGGLLILTGTYKRPFGRVKVTGLTQFVMIGDGDIKTVTKYDDGITPDSKYNDTVDNNITTLDLGVEGEYEINRYFMENVFIKIRFPIMTSTGKTLSELERPIAFSFGFKKRF